VQSVNFFKCLYNETDVKFHTLPDDTASHETSATLQGQHDLLNCNILFYSDFLLHTYSQLSCNNDTEVFYFGVDRCVDKECSIYG
jgi:hypothetical protein